MSIQKDMATLIATNKREFKDNIHNSTTWWKRKHNLDKRMRNLVLQLEKLMQPSLHLFLQG